MHLILNEFKEITSWSLHFVIILRCYPEYTFSPFDVKFSYQIECAILSSAGRSVCVPSITFLRSDNLFSSPWDSPLFVELDLLFPVHIPIPRQLVSSHDLHDHLTNTRTLNIFITSVLFVNDSVPEYTGILLKW